MRVLVIGGSGFLSSAVVAEMIGAGHDVTVFTRGERPLPPGVVSITGDRKDHAAFPLHFEGRPFDAVVDCICYTPEDARSAVRAFQGRVGHFLMISTDFVYGPRRRLPMDEDTPALAESQYGRDKAACEETFLAACRDEGFPATILRPPHIMGAGGHLGTGSLQGRDPMLLDRMQQGEPIILIEGGSLLIQPVVHRDIGQACAAALARAQTHGRAYNVAGPDWATTRDYYALIAATLGIEEVEFLSLPATLFAAAYPERVPFTHHRVYSVERLAQDTGYRPQTSLRHAVFEMIDWLQASDAALPYVETETDASLAALCRAFDTEVRSLLG